MLSIENPPSDPPCPRQFPQLNNYSDERALHKLPLPEVDLSKRPGDHHTPLPNFSIRDYVFTARSKDIKKNWPFSRKNLQLCLKHGVKDVLPPFQHLETVRNPSFKRCTVETNPPEKQNKIDFDKETSGLDIHAVLDSSYVNKLVEPYIDFSSCRSGEGNDFPSTTTSVSQTELESVPDDGQDTSPLETQALLKTSVDAEAAGPPVTVLHKSDSTSRPLGKKCRLIVKFGGNSDRSSAEDIASNCPTVSETMASKICPVCKTFLSSSNTTLNAHIDQCLSGQSTPKWAADSKLIRRRIKPRKTRTIVDIYATAPRCTLEDLDRRNGTSWATVSSLPTRETQETETSSEGKKQTVSPIHPEDVDDVGPVYVDANGTKLRILSKFNDPPSVAKVGEDGAAKCLKAGEGSKYISKKKKKHLAQKQHKYLKLVSETKKISCQKSHGSQIIRGLQAHDGGGKSCEKEHQMPQINPNDCWTLRPWVCSKRRGVTKKIISKEEHQSVTCKWHFPRELLVENDQSFLGDTIMERNHVQRFMNLSENLISSGRNDKRMEESFKCGQVSNKRQCSPGRKRVEIVMVGDRISDKVVVSSPPMKQNANKLRKNGTSMRDSCMLRPPNCTRTRVSLSSKKKVDTCRDAPNVSSTKSSQSSHAMKLPSFSKNALSVGNGYAGTESRPSKTKKCSALKKSQVHFITNRDEELVASCSNVNQQHILMFNHTGNQCETAEITDEVSLGRSSVLETRHEGGLLCISQRKEALALNGSKSAHCCYGSDEGVNIDSSDRISEDFHHTCDCLESAREQAQGQAEDIVMEPASKSFDGSTASLSKSVDTEFYKLNNSFKARSNNFQPMEDYRRLLCGHEAQTGSTEPDFVNDQEVFSAVDIGNDMIGQNADNGVGLDTETHQGNCFPEVDPIPIPGPPGSFLPSPRDMGSEDFQGNSSLTTSRVQYSPDQHEMVDGDSSDSPISAASIISNSMGVYYDFKHSKPSSIVGPFSVQEKIRTGLMAAGFESSEQNTGSVPQAASAGAERTTFGGDCLKLDRISIEKGSLGFKNDEPCCCQRKDRFSPAVSLNHQESHLLRRRTMASVTVPATGKQMGFSLNPGPANMDVRPEISPSSCLTSGSENMVLPVIKPAAGPVYFKESPHSGVRILARSDCESASPSASNPVLRLMGKNLMVVKKNDHTSTPPEQVQSCGQNKHPTSQFPTFSSVSTGNIQNQSCSSTLSKGSLIFGRDPHNTVGQCFDVGLSHSFKCHPDLEIMQAPGRLSVGMFQSQHTSGGFATSMEPHEVKGDYNFANRLDGIKNRLDASPAYNMEKVGGTLDRQNRHADSPAPRVNEIIIIDDVSETETAASNYVAKYNEGWRKSQVVSSGISIPTASNYNRSRVHPFSCLQSEDSPSLGESPPVVCSAIFHAMPARLSSTSPVTRWVCSSEGSVGTGTSSSRDHRSGALYYSPSFS